MTIKTDSKELFCVHCYYKAEDMYHAGKRERPVIFKDYCDSLGHARGKYAGIVESDKFPGFYDHYCTTCGYEMKLDLCVELQKKREKIEKSKASKQ